MNYNLQIRRKAWYCYHDW